MLTDIRHELEWWQGAPRRKSQSFEGTVYTHMYAYVYVCVCCEKERLEGTMYTHAFVCVYVCVYMYVRIYKTSIQTCARLDLLRVYACVHI